MCFPGGEIHNTRDMCFPGGGTNDTREMCFPGGEHITQGICVSQVGEHITPGICVSQVGEDITLGICVSLVEDSQSFHCFNFFFSYPREVFFRYTILSNTFSWPILPKILPNHGLTPLKKISIFRLFQLLVFVG